MDPRASRGTHLLTGLLSECHRNSPMQWPLDRI
jgi:hypothetical protein